MIDSMENEIFGLFVELFSSFAPSMIRILAGGEAGDMEQQLIIEDAEDDDVILDVLVEDDIETRSWLGANDMNGVENVEGWVAVLGLK